MNTIDINEKILNKIVEDRHKDYGDYQENFRLLAVMFNVILHDILKDDMNPHQVAQLMMALKLYRTTKKYKADSYDDLSIYCKMTKQVRQNKKS